MAEGWSNHAIAAKRVITLRSAEKHVSSIFSKLACPPAGTSTAACWPCCATSR
jgi:DNA-binding NarL/FixJ family response regulator